jgi:hypothetical protein
MAQKLADCVPACCNYFKTGVLCTTPCKTHNNAKTPRDNTSSGRLAFLPLIFDGENDFRMNQTRRGGFDVQHKHQFGATAK